MATPSHTECAINGVSQCQYHIICVQEIEIQEEYEVGDILEDDCVNGSDEELEIQPSIALKDFFNYSVKIVNPLRMKDFRTVDLGKDQAFQGIKLLRQFISKSLPSIPDFQKPDVQNVELGYVGPGHGMKGKKVWLLTDGDVSNMYENHKGKPSIRLWCYSQKGISKLSKICIQG